MSGQAPTGTRTRNRRGEGGRLRADILAAAAALIDEHGTEEAVTLRAVARRAGVTAPAIYRHFPDRQAILLAVVRAAFADLTDRLHEAAGHSGSGAVAPVAQLLGVCEAYLGFARQEPRVYRLMFGGVWNAAQAITDGTVSTDDVDDLGREALGIMHEALAACVTDGRSTSTDPVADTVALWLGLHGLASQRAASPAFTWPDDIQERLITSLARLHPEPGAR